MIFIFFHLTIGGYNKEQIVVSNVMRYERYLDKWIKVASMNVPRAKFGMAALDGFIYAIGGYDGTLKLSTMERYCPHTNRWTYVASLPYPLASVMVASLNGYLYCAGKCFQGPLINTKFYMYCHNDMFVARLSYMYIVLFRFYLIKIIIIHVHVRTLEELKRYLSKTYMKLNDLEYNLRK